MSAVWLARTEVPQDNRPMVQRLVGLLVSCGLAIGIVIAARGGCAADGRADAGNSALSTLAPIMATGGRETRLPHSECKGPQAGRSSKTKPTP
ncbi:hypothetical protein GmRootV213_08520 [Variovorax sp. V213]